MSYSLVLELNLDFFFKSGVAQERADKFERTVFKVFTTIE